MDKIKFLTTDNAVQKVYSELGILVPAGALSGTTKAPSIKVVSYSTTQTSITMTINVMSGSDLTYIGYGYKVEGDENINWADLTLQKGTQTFTIDGLELGSGPYAVEIYAGNAAGETRFNDIEDGATPSMWIELQPYINWASADEILSGNKAISDGEEVIGTITNKTENDVNINGLEVTIPAGYFPEETVVTASAVPYTPEYLCFTAVSAGSTVSMSGRSLNIEYSIDECATWTTWDYSSITLTNEGDKVYFRGTNKSGLTLSNINGVSYAAFGGSGAVAVSGDFMTLIRYDMLVDYMPTCCFYYLFLNNTSVVSVEKLPSITNNYCYSNMFCGCTALTTAPELPATTLADYCYDNIFKGCTALTTAPELPATTLAGGCYKQMFYGCTALTTAPELPATTLASECYNSMFRGCTSLTTAPELPATTLTSGCYSSMFYGCTALTTAPELPATTLTSSCYGSMFRGCSNLNKVTTYATAWTTSYTSNWLNGVASTGDFYNLGGATITADSASGIPSGWTEYTSL